MPRLTRQNRGNSGNGKGERGAAGVMVALLMVVLIGAGSLAVDTGEIYAERAQLQNAADAGALAVAQRCHAAGTCTVTQALTWARELAGPNSNDGASAVDSVDLSTPGQVKVVTSTLGSNGAGFLTKLFASALNAGPATVRAAATAAWAPPPGGTAFPLAFSDCSYDLSTTAATGAVQLIKYKPGRGTCTSTSGHVIPGGFGWLDQSGPCQATTSANGTVGSDTGADYPTRPPGGPACDAILTGWMNTILSGGTVEATFPVYDNAGGVGANGWLHVRGYATFKMLGWKFSGGGSPQVFQPGACTSSCRGIIGQFVRFETIDSTGVNSGGGADLGTVDIKLIR